MNTIGLIAAALLLHIHPKTLATKAAKGDIPGAKVGRAWVFIEEDLLAFMRGQYVEKVSCPSTSRKGPGSGGRASASPGRARLRRSTGHVDRAAAQRAHDEPPWRMKTCFGATPRPASLIGTSPCWRGSSTAMLAIGGALGGTPSRRSGSMPPMVTRWPGSSRIGASPAGLGLGWRTQS